MRRHLMLALFVLAPVVARAQSAEICGNGEDDNANGLTDEGCAPSLVTGVCESPLSCADTGMVSPKLGSLHYSLPPDVSPRVPYGPGIGMRRFYLSQAQTAGVVPSLQASGTAAGGTGSVTPSWPTHQVNDVALLIVETAGGEAATLQDAQGFAAVTGGTFGDNVDINGSRLTLFWKRATTSSEASPTVADSGDHTVATIVTFRGVTKTGNPWEAVTGNGTAGTASSTFTMPTTTTSTARDLVVNIVSWSDAFDTFLFWNSLFTLAGATTTAGNDGAFAVATETMATAGTTSGTSGFFQTGFGFSVSQRQARVVIALKPDTTTTEHKPMGDRWSHTYMSWLYKWTASPANVVLHTSRGQDALFSYNRIDNNFDEYLPQIGFKDRYQWVKQRRSFPYEYQVRTMTGETIVYDLTGRLTEIWDTLATPNKVLIAYDGNNQVSTVMDASGKRRLLFAYTSGQLTSIQFQISISSVWTTQHTTSYAYTTGNPTSVTIGGQLAQSNVYTSNYLTAINDGAGNAIATFSYDSATAGKVVRVDTPRGMVGFEYNSSRATCTGKTVLHFNRGNTSSCSVDGDCGTGFLCGGKTGAGSTGVCFRAARCMTVSSPNEDLVTSITALGPPGESCDGTCLDVARYIWDTVNLTLTATQDPSLNYTTTGFDQFGRPSAIFYGDTDSSADNSPGPNTRFEYIFYDPNYPGLVSEIRHQTSPQMQTGGTCGANLVDGSYCTRTQYAYTTEGQLDTVTFIGNTLDISGSTVNLRPVSHYAYDAKGRLTQIDLNTGDLGKTTFEYFTGTGDPLKDDFLQTIKRYKDATAFLTQSTQTLDAFGNPTTLVDANGVLTCLTFDAARVYLTSIRLTMAGQATCATSNSADITTSYLRDSALRLTKFTRPDGSCLIYEYDTKGRLSTTKRRDDCNAASTGDKQVYTYSPDSLLTNIETFDAANVVTKRQEMTYFDSRRLEKLINPVDTSKWTGFAYDAFGAVSEVNGGGNLNKTAYERGPTEARVTTEKRYRDASSFDVWNIFYDWLGNQRQVDDGVGGGSIKTTASDRDDLGRRVKLTNPDLGGFPTLNIYDEASRLVTVREANGGAGEQTHSFTYDRLGRLLSANYHEVCLGSAGNPELNYTYDAPPGSCPVVGSCLRTTGRLAYVKVTLMCDAAKPDKTLDQETWYSYDDAGRMIREHIRDDNGRVADLSFEYTKNGSLSKTTTPAAAVIGATFGSAASNSDTERIAAVWRTTTATPVIDAITWQPYGPLKQYNMQLKVSNAFQRTRITHNLAYRITQLRLEKQNGTAPIHTVDISEDAAGRVTLRNYDPNTNGVQDSYFKYDFQDRVLCETTASVGSCPTDGTNTKNSHSQSPPFLEAGDWKRDLRPIAGSTCMINDFSLTAGTHQLASVAQTGGVPASCTPALGTTQIGHDSRGNRSYDDNTSSLPNDSRDYTYDGRRNLINVHGQYFTGGTWHTYDVSSAFDGKNRRVFKSFLDNTSGKLATWFFYYDSYDRLVEVAYTPDTSLPTTYSVFQLFWIQQRLILYWQTDFPTTTTTRRYVQTDETNRPIDMWSWPATGNGTRVWAINPRAWGMDTNGVGSTLFQPIMFAGQYQDSDTAAYQNDGVTVHRPGIALNGLRSYDPYTGSYLQVDSAVDSTWSTYIYALSDPVSKIDPSGLGVCLPESCQTPNPEDEPGTGGGYCSAVCWFSCGLGISAGCDCSACSGGGGSHPTGCGVGCLEVELGTLEQCEHPGSSGCFCNCMSNPTPQPSPQPPQPPPQPQPPGRVLPKNINWPVRSSSWRCLLGGTLKWPIVIAAGAGCYKIPGDLDTATRSILASLCATAAYLTVEKQIDDCDYSSGGKWCQLGWVLTPDPLTGQLICQKGTLPF